MRNNNLAENHRDGSAEGSRKAKRTEEAGNRDRREETRERNITFSARGAKTNPGIIDLDHWSGTKTLTS